MQKRSRLSFSAVSWASLTLALTACRLSFSGGTSFSVGARLPKGGTSYSAEVLTADDKSAKTLQFYKHTE